MKQVLDVCYSPEHSQFLDVYLPEGDVFPVFVYFHGGGIVEGDKADAQSFFTYMTDRGIAVVSANYRMYPDAKYPDFIEDAAQAVAWAFQNMGSYGKVTGIFVGGSSAGGYLSQMLCFDDTYLAKHNLRPADIAGFVHDAGQPTCHFNVLRERGIDYRRVIVDEAAPLYHIQADKAYPPMLILVAEQDMKNRYEQTVLLVSTLAHFGYTEKVEMKRLPGKHCQYECAPGENDKSVLGREVSGFIFHTLG